MNPDNQLRCDDPRSVEFEQFIRGRDPITGAGFTFWDDEDLYSEDYGGNELTGAKSDLEKLRGATIPIVELLRGAHREDPESLMQLIVNARCNCHELELLCKAKPGFVKQYSKHFGDWPVFFSPKDGGKDFSKSRVEKPDVELEEKHLRTLPLQQNLWVDCLLKSRIALQGFGQI
jgi:hypothetical protein